VLDTQRPFHALPAVGMNIKQYTSFFSLGYNPMHGNNRYQSLIFAHRGASQEAAENTRGAFNKALAYPIDGMETDVQLTRDEICVLWHDFYMTKLGYPEKHIDDFYYDELVHINFASHFSPAVEPEGVLGLQEFIDTYRKHCKLQIEIKNHEWEQPSRHQIKVQQCLDIVGKSQKKDIFISSFNLDSLIYAHSCANNFPLFYALNYRETLTDAKHILQKHPFLEGLCLEIGIIDENFLQLLREQDKEILTYTCNSDAQIRKALDLNVDVLISDYPQKALQIRAHYYDKSNPKQ
jgi:glycerophosphoryl diester phosphodiesterase